MAPATPAQAVRYLRDHANAAGTSLRYLPAYCPLLNPVEHCFKIIKNDYVKPARPRTEKELVVAIQKGLHALTREKVNHMIEHCFERAKLARIPSVLLESALEGSPSKEKGKGKEAPAERRPCPTCGGTDHSRSSSAKCRDYKPKTKIRERDSLKRRRDDDEWDVDIVAAETTVVDALKNLTEDEELKEETEADVLRVTQISKFLCELINVLFARCTDADFSDLDHAFLVSTVHLFTSQTDDGPLAPVPAALPAQKQLQQLRNQVVREFRTQIDANGTFTLPSRQGLTNPVEYLVRQYNTCLQNGVIVHLVKRLEKFVKWRARAAFPDLSLHFQWVIWANVAAQLDAGLVETVPVMTQAPHRAFVDQITPPLAALAHPFGANSLSGIDNHKKSYRVFLPLHRYLLQQLEAHPNVADRPKLFSLAPIYSFQRKFMMLDQTALDGMFRRLGRNRVLIKDVFDVEHLETVNKKFAGTLATDGVQASVHMLKRVKKKRARLPPPSQSFRPTPIFPNTIVLGLDPNKPGGSIAGGLASEVGVKPSVEFDVSRDEYFDLIGKNRAARRLNEYRRTADVHRLENQLETSRTSDNATLTRRLLQIADFGNDLILLYFESPSAKDRWATTIAKPRALHQMGRRFAILGRRGESGRDFGFVRKARNRMGKREREQARARRALMTPPDIVLAVGDLDIIHKDGIRGSSMPLKKLCRLLLEKQYVRALVPVDEDRTSLECNACHFRGNPTNMPNREGREYRRKQCGRCRTWWNRDVNAALNIRAVFLFQNSHGGSRPANFRRGFRAHAPVAGGTGPA